MKSFSLTDLAFLGAVGGEVGDSLIPCMTSNTAPTGNVSWDMSSVSATNPPWHAFDCASPTVWEGVYSTGATDRFHVSYKVGATGALTPTRWVINWQSAGPSPVVVKFWGSNVLGLGNLLDSFDYSAAPPANEATLDRTFTNTTAYADFYFQMVWDTSIAPTTFTSKIRSIRIL